VVQIDGLQFLNYFVAFFVVCIVAIFIIPHGIEVVECMYLGGDYCLSDGEIECRDACDPNKYFYEAGGIFFICRM
jgi:hypothetical protein